MNNRIVKANLNVLNGILSGVMEFTPGLNIISGENGTLKTQLLQSLRAGSAVAADPQKPLRMQAISPKRNSERRAAEGILQFFRQSNRTWEASLNERVNAQINLTGFDNYPSMGDLYYLVFEHRCKDGADRREHMKSVAGEFNKVIQSVFPHYILLAIWDDALGAPRIRMSKYVNTEFPIEALSMGEQEVLSLILNMSTSRENVDVYLIDEPEVHLNWHLEERLFTFIDDLCDTYAKQAIVVTHSRTIFKPRFFAKSQFLSWGEDQRIRWSQQLTKQQRMRLAGDAVEIVALGDFSKVTIFLEDSSHAEAVGAVADLLGVSISISQCGNSTNVKSLYLYQKSHGPWSNAYFMIDGDNQGNPFPGESRFIHLPYYCIENLILDPEILAKIASRTVDEIKETMVEVIRKNRKSIFQKNKFFEFLADSLNDHHMTFDRLRSFDASIVAGDVLSRLGLVSFRDVLPQYLQAAQSAGKLHAVIPERLLEVIQTAASHPASAAAGSE